MTTLNFIDNKYQVKLSLTVFKLLLDFRLSDFKKYCPKNPNRHLHKTTTNALTTLQRGWGYVS